MSLYIGNLSSRVRRDELERVFQRFGRCNVRLKDGYGFVVYEFPPNAEKALKALHKRYICGESLTLTWSNKQPRPYKRFVRAARSYEPYHGRDSARGDYAKRDLGSNDQQGYGMSIRQLESTGGRLSSADVRDEETAYHQGDVKDYNGEEHHGYKKNFLDEGGRIEPNPVDSDRWGENCSPNENGVENGTEFDRYEPYPDYDGKNDDEKHQIAYSGGSPGPQNSQENTGREHIAEATLNHPNDAKVQETCYKCGGSGHKMRNCPQETAARRKFSRFDLRHDADINRRGRGKGELERTESRSWVKLQSSRDDMPTRRLTTDIKSSGSGKHRRLIRSGRSPVAKETDRFQKKDYGGKKRSRKEIGSPKKHSTKKARRSVSSPLHSDYTAPRSHSTSHSSKHMQRSRSRSRSRSISSRPCSLSSDSRSGSTSHNSRSRSSKSRSISRSSSPTSLSLSVSLGRPLPSSSNKAQLNVKGTSDNTTTPESKEILIEQLQPIEGDAGLEDDKLENKMVAVNNENEVPSPTSKNEMEKDQPLQKDNNENQKVSDLPYEVTNPSTLLSDKGTLTAGSLCSESMVEMKDCQNPDVFMMEHVQSPIKKPDSEAQITPCSGHSTSISSQELGMALKHYGLNCQNENERHLPAEAYFGSARLWPWEIIYYRRLKKGPISIENYARRVDQNREFGIVDKYVRSSSGWGELAQVKP